MTKRFTALILALLVLMSFSACGAPVLCSHEWTAASCTAAVSCSLCGEIQGETLPHSYGAWQPEGDEMFRLCTGCGAEERSAADHKLILNSVLQGAWDLHHISIEDTVSGELTVMDAYSTQEEEVAAAFVRFFGEQSEKYVCNAEYIHNGSYPILTEYERNGTTVTEYECVKLLDWEQDGENFIYSFALGDYSSLTDANIWFAMHFKLVLSPGQAPLLSCESSYQDEVYTEFYTRNDELADLAVGSWCAVYPSWDDGTNFLLTLNADRTVTGTVDGVLRGGWCVRPLTKDPQTGKYKFGIAIICFADGFYGGYTPMNGGDTIWVGDSPEQLYDIKKEEIRLHLNHEDEILDLFPAGLIKDPEKYRPENKDNWSIEGQWTSSLMSGVNILYYGRIKGHPELPSENRATCYYNDNYLDIRPDGTFTAKVREGEIEGTWEKREAPEHLQQHHCAVFFEELEYYTFTSATGEKYDAEFYCFGNNASLHLSLHEGPVTVRGFDRLTPLKYVFTRAID